MFLALPSITHAQGYPDRVVKIQVGYSPGGNIDTPTRLVANKLGQVLGGSVVVENKPGAGGAIAAAHVAKAPPDGHTLHACGVGSHAIAPALFSRLAYHPRDLVPVAMIGQGTIRRCR